MSCGEAGGLGQSHSMGSHSPGSSSSLPWSVLPIFIYTVGMSLAMPCLSIFALDPFPAQRGLAASCQTFFQSGFNGLAAALIAPALWGSTLTLALGMAGMVLIGGSAALLHQRLRLVPR